MRSVNPYGLAATSVVAAVFALGFAGNALAEVPTLVAEMLANAPSGGGTRCGYTRQSVDENLDKRERFDPLSSDSPWTLISVNGQPPTEEVLRDYMASAENRADRLHPLDFDLREKVEPGSWKLISETPEDAVFGFRLRSDETLDDGLLEKVRSRLTLDKRRMQPKRIVIESTGPAYVAPLVRISEYRQEMRFVWNDSVGAAALTEQITHRRGRAVGIKNLKKDRRVLYSDYECTAPTGALAVDGDSDT